MKSMREFQKYSGNIAFLTENIPSVNTAWNMGDILTENTMLKCVLFTPVISDLIP